MPRTLNLKLWKPVSLVKLSFPKKGFLPPLPPPRRATPSRDTSAKKKSDEVEKIRLYKRNRNRKLTKNYKIEKTGFYPGKVPKISTNLLHPRTSRIFHSAFRNIPLSVRTSRPVSSALPRIRRSISNVFAFLCSR
jgi:hypothetical protein